MYNDKLIYTINQANKKYTYLTIASVNLNVVQTYLTQNTQKTYLPQKLYFSIALTMLFNTLQF